MVVFLQVTTSLPCTGLTYIRPYGTEVRADAYFCLIFLPELRNRDLIENIHKQKSA
jgi:hypothetical protein